MKDIDSERLRTNIREQLKRVGKTPRAVSIEANLNPDTLNKFLASPTRTLRFPTIAAIARAIPCEISDLTGEEGGGSALSAEPLYVEPRNLQPGVAYGGLVQAGLFREQNLYDQDGDYRRVAISPDPRFRPDDQFADEVGGDSMVNAGILPGMWVLCVTLEAWEKRYGEPRDGVRVVVQRSRDGHPDRELTVKTLRIFRDRIELQPESPNPAWKPLVFPNPPVQVDETQGIIIGVVLSAVRLFGEPYIAVSEL